MRTARHFFTYQALSTIETTQLTRMSSRCQKRTSGLYGASED